MLPHFRILVGPGDRLRPLVTLLSSLREDQLGPEAPLAIHLLRDVEGLLQRQGPAGLALLDADGLDVEDLGIVRRFVQRHPGWELVLTGDDDRSRAARRLSSLRRTRWLPWPLDVDQLTAMLVPPSGLAPTTGPATGPVTGAEPTRTAPPIAEPETTEPHSLAPDPTSDLERDPERGAQQALPTGLPRVGDLGDTLRAVLGSADLGSAGLGSDVRVGESGETSLADDLASIEAILRGEARSETEPRTEPTAAPFAESVEDVWDDLEEGEDPAGLELTREEMDAFLDPLEDELSEVAEAPAADSQADEDAADRPPTWFKAQVADLKDLAQGLDLSARALRESQAEESQEAQEEAARRLEGDVLRLVQFARTLGYLAVPPECGAQHIALGTLLQEQLVGVAGSDADSPRFLFRAEQEAWVLSDKALLVASFDALLQVAAACSNARDVVRVAVEPDQQSGQVEVHVSVPGEALSGLSPAEVLAPYGLRRVLPTIGANALAAASRILEGQGGRLALGLDERGERMLFRVQLPLAPDEDLPRPRLGEARQSDTSASGEFG